MGLREQVARLKVQAMNKSEEGEVHRPSPLGENMADRIGQRFGDYRLIRFLGNGTFGDVYLAEQVGQKTPAAVKVFKAQLTPDFIDEVRTVLLKHPHIVSILDFGVERREEGAIPYLVMEYAPNGTLLQRHPRGTCLPQDTVILYVQQIAAALQYAHDHKRIHRDVKPENLLFGAHDEVLLSDFGIATVAHTTRSQRTEETLGTAPYMAPEQWQGKPLPASDQYALAVVVYEWICGERPFRGDPHQLMYQHCQLPPPPLRTKVPMLSAAVEQILMTALSKEPRQRFATVQAFATALEQASRTEQNTLLSDREVSSHTLTTSPLVHINDATTFLMLSPNEARAGTKRQVMLSGEKSIEVSLPPGIEHGSSLHIGEPGNNHESMIVTVVIDPKIPSPGSIPPASPQRSLAGRIEDLPAPPARSRPSRWRVVMICTMLLLLVVGASFLPRLWVSKGTNPPPPRSTQTSSADTTNTVPLVDPKIATTATQAYEQNIVRNGIMFGFDAGHTNVNLYERVLSPTTVGHLKQAWGISGDGIFQGSPTVAYGRAYIGSDDHNFYAFDVETGDLSWKQHTEGAIHSTAAVVDGVVYVGSDDGRLYAYDAQKGTPKWSTNLGVPVMGSPIVVNDIIYVNANTSYPSNNYLYALSARTGHRLWDKKFDAYVSVPTVAGGVVYVTGSLGFGGSGPIWAYDAETGVERWNTLSTLSQCGGDPTVANRVVFVNCEDGNLYALNAQTQNQLWTASGGSWEGPDVAIESDIVYVNTGDALYARSATTGDSLGSVLTQKAGSPTIGNGVIYACANDGYLYAIDITTKTKLWSFQIASFFIGNSPFPTPIVANGTVYINVGSLLAFRLPS